jgi:hypothetical protein
MDATLSPALSLLGKGEEEDFALSGAITNCRAHAAAAIFSLSSLGARRGPGRGASDRFITVSPSYAGGGGRETILDRIYEMHRIESGGTEYSQSSSCR